MSDFFYAKMLTLFDFFCFVDKKLKNQLDFVFDGFEKMKRKINIFKQITQFNLLYRNSNIYNFVLNFFSTEKKYQKKFEDMWDNLVLFLKKENVLSENMLHVLTNVEFSEILMLHVLFVLFVVFFYLKYTRRRRGWW